MKKHYLFVMILVLMTVSLFPASALAKPQSKSQQFVNVDVYNHSGSALTVLLTNKHTGDRSFLNLLNGVSSESLLQGVYDYSVTTPCGLETGTWNVTPGRILWISCRTGNPVAVMMQAGSACEQGVYYHDTGDFMFATLKSVLPGGYHSLKDFLDQTKQFSDPDAYMACWNINSGAIYR